MNKTMWTTGIRILSIFALSFLFLVAGSRSIFDTNTVPNAAAEKVAANASQIVYLPLIQRQPTPTFTPTFTPTLTRTPTRTATPILSGGVLRVNPANRRYFTNNSGKVIYLAGSHTWRNFQAFGAGNPPADNFDYAGYLSFLKSNNLNLMRLWSWEQSKGPDGYPSNYLIAPLPYLRTGPGNANDGLPKFDLTRFNQAYFDRMRQHIVDAGAQGIYVDIQLFNGWSVGSKNGGPSPWPNHPFNTNNNINGINGDSNGDGNGYEVHTLANPAITALQEAYVKKVIDTVNDLDNVLYETAVETESGAAYTAWHNHMIDYIHTYEATLPKQHPVGFTSEYPNGNNNDLFNSRADWVSPNDGSGYMNNPPAATGNKVIISDTDHLWGLGGDRVWVWKSFTRGLNVAYMDCYNEDTSNPLGCPIAQNDPTRLSLLLNLGYARSYANRMNLSAMTPRGDLASSGYALANPVASGAEYLVYLPTGGSVTVNLSATPGTLTVEWFNPSNGATINGGTAAGGTSRTLTAPFGGDAVLYLR